MLTEKWIRYRLRALYWYMPYIYMHLFLFIPIYTNISKIFSSLLYYIYKNTCDILLIFSQFPFINEQ